MIRARLPLAIGTALLLSACGDPGSGGAQSTETDRPDRTLLDFVLLETVDGRPDWRLVAEQADYYRADAETRLEGVHLDFYDDEGTVASRLTSDRGMISEGTGDMIARGNVVLVSDEGDTLRTEELRYSQVEDAISGPGRVRISKPDRELTGVGFRAKPDLTEYELDEDVRIVMRDEEGVLPDER